MSTFNEMKFSVSSQEQSKQLQEVLFKIGYKWQGDFSQKVQLTDKKFIYAAKGGDLTWGMQPSFFADMEKKEVDTNKFITEHNEMIPHVHKDLIIAWANGAKIQQSCDGEWHDIENPRWTPFTQYRIKPEPVEMWKWCIVFADGHAMLINEYHATEESVKKCVTVAPVWVIKLEPTKKLIEVG